MHAEREREKRKVVKRVATRTFDGDCGKVRDFHTREFALERAAGGARSADDAHVARITWERSVTRFLLDRRGAHCLEFVLRNE